MISVKEALEAVMRTAEIIGVESIGVHESIGRTLAEEIYADRAMPPFDRVMMDGICIDYDSYAAGQRIFTVESIAAAGSPTVTLGDKNMCIEIMTGAPLAKGADTVIRYEDLKELAGGFEIIESIQRGKNIHPQGSDHSRGDVLLHKNKRIKAIDINVLASVGKSELSVYRNPKVAVISSGDELVDIEDTPSDYQIRKSNVFMLQSRLRELGVASKTFHFVDDSGSIYNEMKSILEDYDVLLMSGGVSKGKFDFIPEVLDRLGFEKLFHRVAQRPGKPFWFGQMGHKKVFAFPGNPVSTLACFHKYFVPWLYKVRGLEYQHLRVVLTNEVTFKPDLDYFAQATISQSPDGRNLATVQHGNGSGDMVSPANMDGFIELPKGRDIYKVGEVYDFMRF